MLARLIIIGFGLASILPALVYNGVTSVYPRPDRATFFPIEAPLSQNAAPEERRVRAETVQQRNREFDQATRIFARVLLVVATLVGLTSVLIGDRVTASSVSGGLILGGIFTAGFGYAQYAWLLEDWWRFIALALGFVTLLYVGFRQHKKREQS